ncbi:MAG TPA: glycosyltransferase family 2 protein [Acidobacteriaceae bacterium]|jgi:dolichol-phosphate mannosyltransferase|nr:glycosyltransferase family 2 protein [Acidobacteriaceae bacterium]
MEDPVLSVVVPCYNEQDGVEECHRRLRGVLAALGIPWEIVFVNDGSKDATLPALLALQGDDPHVVIVDLSRNFGHQLAVTAGIETARGSAIVMIDADLQDPPELIAEMVRLWRANYQVVYGVRTARRGETGFKLWSAKAFYRIINALADVEIPLDSGDFRLIDRRVAEVVLKMRERHRLLRAMYSWVGFPQTGIPYERAPRFAGKTKYPLRRMIGLALDGIISFSTAPLRMLTFTGIATAFLAFAGAIYALVVRLFTHHWVTGWATLFIAVTFFSGLQLISLGVMGEYLGRIYTEVKQRPLYVIQSVFRGASADSAGVPVAAVGAVGRLPGL